MRILILADGRSPITKNWLLSLKQLGMGTIFVSSYPCERPANADEFFQLPIAFSNFAAGSVQPMSADGGQPQRNGAKKNMIRKFRSQFQTVRYLFGPLTLPFAGRRLQKIIQQTQPDLIHALRIPFEGMTASFVRSKIPLVVSIWGNDLTLHAAGSALMRHLTIRTLQKAQGLAADTARDIRLGRNHGFSPLGKTLVIPGNGGIDFAQTRLTAESMADPLAQIPPDWNVIVNPRGFRPNSVRNDTFFQSIPAVIRQLPNTMFVCCSMAEQPEALEWVETLQIARNVMLLPTLLQSQLYALFHRAIITLTISQHDGTPNSLLEAMTIGCFPIAGDIESLREWITPGINGFLVDPGDAEQLTAAIINAIMNPQLREKAAAENQRLILSRAETDIVQTQIAMFYNLLTN